MQGQPMYPGQPSYAHNPSFDQRVHDNIPRFNNNGVPQMDRRHYPMIFMGLGIMDISMLIIDIVLTLLAIIGITNAFYSGKSYDGVDVALWPRVLTLLASIFTLITVTIPRVVCFSIFAYRDYQPKMAGSHWKYRLLALVVYMCVGIGMTIVQTINAITENDVPEEWAESKRTAIIQSVIFILICAVCFLGIVCMVQGGVIWVYRKYHLEYSRPGGVSNNTGPSVVNGTMAPAIPQQ